MWNRYSRKDAHRVKERWEGQTARINAIIDDLRASRREHSGEVAQGPDTGQSRLLAFAGRVLQLIVGRGTLEPGGLQARVDGFAGAELDWTRHLRASEESGWDELALLSTCSSRFHIPGEAAPRDLRGLHLTGVDLSGSEGLSDTCLDVCHFQAVLLEGATIIGSSLRNARMDDSCVLDHADLMYSDLRDADCAGVSMASADLTRADLRGGNFENCDLSDAILRFVRFSEFTRESLPGLLRLSSSWTRFGGDYQTSDSPDESSDPLLKQYIDRCNRRRVFAEQHPILATAIRLLSNYLYSPARVLFWALLVWALFGLLYTDWELPTCLGGTAIEVAVHQLHPQFSWGLDGQVQQPFDAFYLSAANLTGLGAENVVPLDLTAQVYTTVQGFIGYVVMAILVASLLRWMAES